MNNSIVARNQYKIIINFAHIYSNEKDSKEKARIYNMFLFYIDNIKRLSDSNDELVCLLEKYLSKIELLDKIRPEDLKDDLRDAIKLFCELSVESLKVVNTKK